MELVDEDELDMKDLHSADSCLFGMAGEEEEDRDELLAKATSFVHQVRRIPSNAEMECVNALARVLFKFLGVDEFDAPEPLKPGAKVFFCRPRDVCFEVLLAPEAKKFENTIKSDISMWFSKKEYARKPLVLLGSLFFLQVFSQDKRSVASKGNFLSALIPPQEESPPFEFAGCLSEDPLERSISRGHLVKMYECLSINYAAFRPGSQIFVCASTGGASREDVQDANGDEIEDASEAFQDLVETIHRVIDKMQKSLASFRLGVLPLDETCNDMNSQLQGIQTRPSDRNGLIGEVASIFRSIGSDEGDQSKIGESSILWSKVQRIFEFTEGMVAGGKDDEVVREIYWTRFSIIAAFNLIVVRLLDDCGIAPDAYKSVRSKVENYKLRLQATRSRSLELSRSNSGTLRQSPRDAGNVYAFCRTILMNHLPSERKEASGSTRAGGVGHSLALGAGNGHESRNRFPFELPNHIMMEMWEQCDEAFTRLSGAAHTSLWEVVTERDLVSAVYKSIAESCKNPKSTGVVYTPRAVIRYMFNQMDYSVSYPSSIFHASTWNKQEDEFVPPARGSFVRPLFDPAVGSGGFISEALVRVRTCILNLKWWTMSNNHPTVPLQKFVYLRRAICSMLGSIVGVDIDFFSSRVATTNFFLQLLPLFVHLKAVKDQVNVEAVQKVMRNFMNAKKEKQVKFLQPLLKEFLSLKDASFSAPLIACGNAMDLYTGRNVQMEVLCDGIILPLRYDYVIANPPYVSLSNDAKRGTGSAFDVHSKNPFWKKCELVSQKLEHFMLEIALSKTNDGGKVCFIIPRSWMTSTIENNVKRIMLEQNIQSISFLPQGVFAGSAEVQTLVLVLEKSAASKYVKVFDVEIRRESGSLFQTAVANKVQSDLEVLKPWSFRSAKWLKAHEDVERRVCHPEPDNVQLGKLVSSTRGVETGNTKSVRISETEVEVLIGTYGSREKTKELRSVLVPRLTKLEMCPFVVRTELVGTETQCYLLKDTPAKPLSSLYRTILKERPGVTKKEAGFGYAKKLKDQLASIAASDARIIYQLGAGRKALHVGRRIRPFCLDDSGKVVENNFRILSPRLEHKGTLKYLLGLLNSQVAQYVYSEIHFNAQQRDEHINLEDAKACELMVVTGSDTNQKRMAQMVDEMVSLKRQLEQYVRVFPKGTLQAKEQRGPLLDQLSPTTTQILHEKEWTSLSDFLPEHEMDLSEAQKFIVSNVFASSTDIRCHVISLIRREFALQRTMDFLAFTLYDIEADSRRFVDTHLRVTECLFWLDQVHIQCSCHGHETMILVVESKWVRLSDVKKRLCSPSFFELSDASLFCLMHGDLLLNDSAFLGDQTFYLDNGELWIDLLLFEDSKCDSRHSVPEEMHSPRIPNVVLKDICSLPQCQLVPRAGGRLERFSDLIASVDNTVSFRETCGLGRGIFQGFVQQFYGEGDYEALKGQLRGNLSQAVEKKKREELRRVKESEHGRVLTILGKVVEELQSNAEHYVGGEVTTSDLDELCEHLEVFLYTLSAAIKERSAESKDTHKTGIPLLMFDFSVDDVIFRCLSKLFRCIIVLFDFQKCTKMIYGEGKKSIGFLRWDGSHYDSVMFSKSVDDLLKVPSLEYHVERDTKRPKLVTRPVAKGEVASPHRNTSNDFKRPEKMGPFQRFVAENDQMLAQWDGPERQARAFEMWGKLDAQEKKRYRDEHLDMLEQSSGLKKHRDAKDNREAEIVEEDVMLWDSEDVEHDPPPKKYRTDNGEVQ